MRRRRCSLLYCWSSRIFPMSAEALRLRGHVAARGRAAGPLAHLPDAPVTRRGAGPPLGERTALAEAIARSAADLGALAASQTSEAAAILEFQLALLEDPDLTAAALVEIDAGAPADDAWRRALDAQIADYAAAEDGYFRARAADLTDLRDRGSRALAGHAEARLVLPEAAILVANDLPPSRFLEIDWTRSAGIA